MTNSIREIRQADCILITGSNTAESHPVISYEVIRAVKRGANLILIDPRRVPLARHATHYLQAQPGTDIYVFLAMAHVILREGLADTEFLEQRVEGFEAFRASVTENTPEAAALVSGVPAEQIEAAARQRKRDSPADAAGGPGHECNRLHGWLTGLPSCCALRYSRSGRPVALMASTARH